MSTKPAPAGCRQECKTPTVLGGAMRDDHGDPMRTNSAPTDQILNPATTRWNCLSQTTTWPRAENRQAVRSDRTRNTTAR